MLSIENHQRYRRDEVQESGVLVLLVAEQHMAVVAKCDAVPNIPAVLRVLAERQDVMNL